MADRNTDNSTAQGSNAMWGGRFADGPSAIMREINASIPFDKALWRQDIAGSRAHAAMLAAQGILTAEDAKAIDDGLQSIAAEYERDGVPEDWDLEDIHMTVESRLTQLIGPVAGRLHTARSRNDQVATDFKLWVREAIEQIDAGLAAVQAALVERAEQHAGDIMPGFTHLQTAQPVTLGHHLMAYYEMLRRDRMRFAAAKERLDECPLGAAALAGTGFDLDREATARALGFARPTANSLDTVSDRDFAMDYLHAASLVSIHLSRLAEEIIIWASQPFGFIRLPDSLSTGSSIMPQKKNPDVPELVRGKTGRVNGSLISLLTLMKGQPLAYNKDNQEDKEPVFDLLDTVKDCLHAYAEMVPAIICNRDAMYSAAKQGYATATDLADYLVMKGLPFRDAHAVVGKSVAYGIEQGKDLADLSLQEIQNFSTLITDDVFDVLTLEGSVNARKHLGGTAPEQVLAAVASARAVLDKR